MLTPTQLRALDGNDPGFDPEIPERGFEFVNQGFFNLSFWIHNGANQPFAQGADALTHHLARIGDFDDQHTTTPIRGATLAAVRLENLFQFTKLCGGNQPCQGKLGGATGQ